MIIYRDIISNDEMFSDIYKITESKSGLLLYVEGKTVTRKEGFDDNLIGANASAEEAAEDTEIATISGVDIVLNHKLAQVAFTKETFKGYLKSYVKAIKTRLAANNSDRLKLFMEGAEEDVKGLLRNFKNYEFYTGENMDVNGAVGLLDYRAGDDVPFMTFFKDGLEIEKC